MASLSTRWRMRVLRPRVVTTSTGRRSRSARSMTRPPRSSRLRPGSRSTRKSMSLAASASPRATEPNTRTLWAPCCLASSSAGSAGAPMGPGMSAGSPRVSVRLAAMVTSGDTRCYLPGSQRHEAACSVTLAGQAHLDRNVLVRDVLIQQDGKRLIDLVVSLVATVRLVGLARRQGRRPSPRRRRRWRSPTLGRRRRARAPGRRAGSAPCRSRPDVLLFQGGDCFRAGEHVTSHLLCGVIGNLASLGEQGRKQLMTEFAYQGGIGPGGQGSSPYPAARGL